MKIKTGWALKQYYKNSSGVWSKIQKELNERIKRKITTQVPAYKKFLFQHAKKAQAPLISKKNYFSQFPIRECMPIGMFEKETLVMTATSGSTGTPTYFVRNDAVDMQYADIAEHFLHLRAKTPTLFINCFGMGIWIGGIITYQAFKYASIRSKYPLSIINPGVNKKEIYHALRDLAPQYKNIILAGYPPFIKDILDGLREERIDLSKLTVRLVFAAENFSESFRDYVSNLAGVKDLFIDTMNIYGSAELGAMAFETPFSIYFRRLLVKNKKIARDILYKNKLPTIAQYNPNFISFEVENKKILVTANAVTPFYKYDIGDTGEVYTFVEIAEIIKTFKASADNKNREAQQAYKLPFIFIYERNDFSTKLYGAIIYPEHVKEALLDQTIQKKVTGKFVLETITDKKQNQSLVIYIESRPQLKITAIEAKNYKEKIIKTLRAENAEYKYLYTTLQNKVSPKLIFKPHADGEYFPVGIKQRWIKRI